MKLLFILPIMTLIGCSLPSEDKTDSLNISIEMDIAKAAITTNPCILLDQIIGQIDSLSYAPYTDEGDSLLFAYNNEVKSLAEICANCQDYPLDSIKNYGFEISEDGNFGIISWNTQLGGSWKNIEHLKLWNSNNQIHTFNSATELTLEEGDMNSTYYYKVDQIINKYGDHIYLCHGSGQFSYSMPFYEIKAFQIDSNQLKPSHIFPNNQNYLSAFYDLSDGSPYETVTEFEITNNQKLVAPTLFDNSYIGTDTLDFDGVQFINPHSLDAFIPSGFEILESFTGQVFQNSSSKEDVVMILRDTIEHSGMMETDRPLLILSKTESGYKLMSQCDKAVMCQDCGGVFGDPLDYLDVSPGLIQVGHYGGSSDRWYEIYEFNYDKISSNWLLNRIVSGGHSVFDLDNDGEIDEYPENTLTSDDFGSINLDSFDYETNH